MNYYRIKNIFFILFFSCISIDLYAQNKIVLSTHNLFPYSSYPDNAEVKFIADETFTGVAIEPVRYALDMMNFELEIQVVPWERAQIMAKNNETDGFFAASQKDSRDDFAIMSTYIADQKWNWYILKENPLNPESPDFKEKAQVASFLGANMLKWMNQENYNIKGTPPDTEHLLKILLAKRVDAVMANNYVMDALLKKYRVEDKVKIFTNQNKPLGVYFTKKFIAEHPDFLENFNKYINKYRRETAKWN